MNENIDKKKIVYETRKKINTPTMVGVCLAIFVFLFSFSSCFGRIVKLCSGRWCSSGVTVGDYFISNIEITVRQADTELCDSILVDEKIYQVSLTFDGEAVEDIQAMYYSKKLRITFVWNTKSVFIMAAAKNAREEIYLDAEIVIQEEKSESLEEINTVSTTTIMKQSTSKNEGVKL